MNNELEHLKLLVSENRLNEVFESLIRICKNSFPDFELSALQLKSRFRALEKQVIDGTISDEDKNIEQAKITQAVFSLISLLIKTEETPIQNIDSQEIAPKEKHTIDEIIEQNNFEQPLLNNSEREAANVKTIDPKLILVAILLLFSVGFVFFKFTQKNDVKIIEKPKEKVFFDGKMMFEDLSPAPDISLKIDNFNTSAVTDRNGKFKIEISDTLLKEVTLNINYKGKIKLEQIYLSRERFINGFKIHK